MNYGSLRLTDWLPTTKKEMKIRDWEYVDVILFSGDAYIDHPAFGAAVIGRLLEKEDLRVAIVPQPNWRDDLRDFKKLGIPRLFFAISAGAMDSMINRYTANKRPVSYTHLDVYKRQHQGYKACHLYNKQGRAPPNNVGEKI